MIARNDPSPKIGNKQETDPVSARSAYADQLRVLPFEELAGSSEEVWSENRGQIYRLRRTEQGKLILTE